MNHPICKYHGYEPALLLLLGKLQSARQRENFKQSEATFNINKESNYTGTLRQMKIWRTLARVTEYHSHVHIALTQMRSQIRVVFPDHAEHDRCFRIFD